ncbi:cytochrome C assembly family protein [Halochromatium glycolicum]|uniref:Cytochrome C biogenesis protein n=1 Tax=Halochromatium glycolicum TaxID=85075 RepID=A0AAJ0U3R3_9GAMM|nr:cytochrome c biogenesis protein CcsA [Halochromatium glycolicum]MBK1704730.1 cytochrome C biogenesis protein [Halochromatium glycolicum]
MNNVVISIATLIAYIGSASLIGWRLFTHQPDTNTARLRGFTLGLAYAGLTLHTWLLYMAIFSHTGLNLGFFNALSLAAWTVVAALLLSSLSKPIENLGLVVLPLAALTVLLDMLYPSAPFLGESTSWVLKLHVLLSMLAYSLLTLGSVQAVLLWVQDSYLRNRRPGGFVRALPPLLTMEDLMFEMLGIGFILLTLALLSGFAFLDDMFAQHLVHKTVLSVLAWMVFGGLLLGRRLWGWRGRKAISWTLSGFGILILAYFGSKLVLELILHQPT